MSFLLQFIKTELPKSSSEYFILEVDNTLYPLSIEVTSKIPENITPNLRVFKNTKEDRCKAYGIVTQLYGLKDFSQETKPLGARRSFSF